MRWALSLRVGLVLATLDFSLHAGEVFVTKTITTQSCLRSLSFTMNSQKPGAEGAPFTSIAARVNDIAKAGSVHLQVTSASGNPLVSAVIASANRNKELTRNAEIKRASRELINAVRERIVINRAGDGAYIQLVADVNWKELAFAPEFRPTLEKNLPDGATLENYATGIAKKLGNEREFSSHIEVVFSEGNWQDFAEGKPVVMRGTHVKGTDYLEYITALQGTWLQSFTQNTLNNNAVPESLSERSSSRFLEEGEFKFSGSLSEGFVWEIQNEVIELQIPVHINSL